MISSRSKISDIYLAFVLIGITLFSFTPLLKNPIFLLFLGLLATVIIVANAGCKSYRQNGVLMSCVCLYIMVCIAYKALGVSSASFGVYARHLMFFIPILLMLVLPKGSNKKAYRFAFWAMVVIIVANIMDNIRLCILYPELMVLVNRDMTSADMMGMNINIGGSRFYNAVFFFFAVCFLCFINSKQRKVKSYLLGAIAVTTLFIIVFCMKASVIAFTLLTAFLLIFAKRSKNLRVFIIRIIAPALFVLLIVALFKDQIIDMIIKYSGADRLAQRLIYMIDEDSADMMAENTVEARANLWLVSVRSWLDNPVSFFCGIGDHRANYEQGITASMTGIGQHSDFFDTLGRYGLIGLILIFNILRLGFKYMMTFFDDRYKTQLFVIFLMFTLFGFTKGVFQPDIACALFFLLPLSSQYINAKH